MATTNDHAQLAEERSLMNVYAIAAAQAPGPRRNRAPTSYCGGYQTLFIPRGGVFLGRGPETAHQLLEELAGLGVGHQALLHLLGRAPDVRVRHQPLGHGLEAGRHVIDRES